jgi:hypothetical protein
MSNFFSMPNDADETITFNLDPDAGKRIPEGEYLAKVVDAKAKNSASNVPMLEITFAITGGTEAGKEIRSYYSTSSAASWKAKELLDAVGLGSEAKDGTKTVKPKDLINKVCKISVGDGEYNGKVRSQINKVYSHLNSVVGI